MKRSLTLALAAFALVIAAPSALAVRMRVVDAPLPSGTAMATVTDCASISASSPNTACSVTDINATYTMRFVDAGLPGCAAATSVAGVGPTDLDGFTYCIILVNFTKPKAPLTGFNFTFEVPNAGPNDDYSQVQCTGIPGNVSSTFCPPAPLIAGASVTASFSAHPGVPVAEVAYLFVDFANQPGDASVTFSGPVSVPEPGELGLFGLGLLAIGLGYGWEKRRKSCRTGDAV